MREIGRMGEYAVEEIPAKTIVTRNKSTGWFGADYNMNIYRGCPHGCIYCDSRSDCYQNHDFDRVKVKKNALEVIRNDLRRKVCGGVIATGSMSDPYNPLEKEMMLTRHALELIHAYGFGVAIATKGTLVTRDIDLLSDVKSQAPVIVKITITAASDELSCKIEPNAPPSSKRFETIARLSEEGIYTGILLMPVLPFIEDSEDNIRQIVTLAAEAGAKFIYPAFGMTLRQGQREYFYAKLDELYPGLRGKYERLYGGNYGCKSPASARLKEVFNAECAIHGLYSDMRDITAAYKRGYGDGQLSFF